jgi:hypothetical protein
MKTVWTARVTFLSFSYRVGNYDRAIDDFTSEVPYYPIWHQNSRSNVTHLSVTLTTRKKKNKVLKFIRKFHEKDSNILWCIVKFPGDDDSDYYDSDSSSDEYDGVHQVRREI